jgi:hypothetical protein
MSGNQPDQPRERGVASMPAAHISELVSGPARQAQKPSESESP